MSPDYSPITPITPDYCPPITVPCPPITVPRLPGIMSPDYPPITPDYLVAKVKAVLDCHKDW
jgi:hypothetical protein